jgi:hypothetical protein
MTAAGAAVWFGGGALIRMIEGTPSETATAIIAGAVTVAVSITTLLVTKYLESRDRIRYENRARKIPVYEELVSFFFAILYRDRLRLKRMSDAELAKHFVDSAERVILWGSDDVVRDYVRFRQAAIESSEGGPPEESMVTLEDLLYSVRRDLGHANAGLRRGDLLNMFINDIRDRIGEK